MTNTNEYRIDTDLIETGDRILISDDELSESLEWATMVRNDKDGFAYVRLDDCNLPRATYFSDEGALEPCYLMYTAHITQHIPADELLPGRVGSFPDVVSELPEAHEVYNDILSTLAYLNTTTKRKWKATTKDVQLDVGDTATYAGTMTIAFTEKGE